MAENPAFVAVPGPKLLEAIGAVTVKWSVLEFSLDNLLFWASDPEDPRIPKLLKETATRTRWAALKDLISLDYKNHPGSLALIALINRALDIKGERDTIVHGLYSDPASSKSEALATMLKGNRVRSEWPVTALRAKFTASKIDQLVHQLFLLEVQYGEQLGGPDKSVLLNAWRHKDRK